MTVVELLIAFFVVAVPTLVILAVVKFVDRRRSSAVSTPAAGWYVDARRTGSGGRWSACTAWSDVTELTHAGRGRVS